MEEYIDELIMQAKQDIKEAQRRLNVLTEMKGCLTIKGNTVSVRKASQMIGISERSTREWLRIGKLKGQRIGKYYAVDVDSIKEALAGL